MWYKPHLSNQKQPGMVICRNEIELTALRIDSKLSISNTSQDVSYIAYLHRYARKARRKMHERIKIEQSVQPQMISSIFRPGNFNCRQALLNTYLAHMFNAQPQGY
jgi:hypothetical protein